MSCSSAVSGAAAVLRSPAGRPEGAEPAQAETDEAAGSDQPTHPGSPAQVTPRGAWSALQGVSCCTATAVHDGFCDLQLHEKL